MPADPRLDSIDRTVLRVMFRHRGWMTTNQIADQTRLAWATVKKHLGALARYGYVIKGMKQGNIYWKING